MQQNVLQKSDALCKLMHLPDLPCASDFTSSKAKNNKGDFIYAPKSDSNVENAVLKVTSKDCALQCDWTALESDGFEIHAFLPKPTANGSEISNYGAFVSIDSRPISNIRGTIKQVGATFKERLRKSRHSLTAVKDPFFSMNSICPPDSYDSNIEPAKGDVMFGDCKVVLGVVNILLKSYYSGALMEMEVELPTSAQPYAESDIEESESHVPDPAHLEPPAEMAREPRLGHQSKNPRWRSSMYGIDEDDLEHLQEDEPLVIEEEEGRRAADVSNPWTIARMNAAIKPNVSITNGQLLSPAKSGGDMTIHSSSLLVAMTPPRKAQPEPLTPQTSSRPNHTSLLDNELRQSIESFPQGERGGETSNVSRDIHTVTGHGGLRSGLPLSRHADAEQPNNLPGIRQPRGCQVRIQVTLASPQGILPKPTQNDGVEELDDTWFGQPMRGSRLSQPSRRPKRCKEHGPPLFVSDITSSPRRPFVEANERMLEGRLYSEDNTDIRSFFGQGETGRQTKGPSITLINSQPFPAIRSKPHIKEHSRALSATYYTRASIFAAHVLQSELDRPKRG